MLYYTTGLSSATNVMLSHNVMLSRNVMLNCQALSRSAQVVSPRTSRVAAAPRNLGTSIEDGQERVRTARDGQGRWGTTGDYGGLRGLL